MKIDDQADAVRQVPSYISYGVLLIFSAALLFWIIPNEVPDSSFGEVLTPRDFPKFIALLIGTVALLLIGRTVTAAATTVPFPSQFWHSIGAILAVTLAYIIAIPFIGYYVTTTIALAILFRLVGVRSVKRIVVCSIGTGLAIYLGLTVGLGVHFPHGVLI